MLKCILSLALVFTMGLTQAQYQFGISLGGSHERQYQATGSHVRAYLHITDYFRPNIEYAHYLDVSQKDGNITVKQVTRELNFNLQYQVLLGERLGLYPILGLNFIFGHSQTENNGVFTENKKNQTGLNFGFGMAYHLGHFSPYLESRSIVSNNSYLLFSAGVLYSFKQRGN